MVVMIGVDPHKRSHTAVAVDGDDVELGRLEVRASGAQVGELVGWADRFGERTWAIESADGLGYLLGQQLVAAGERVLDVPATLPARVRVLASSRSNKNDANDGYSVAVAALHAPGLRVVERADHAAVLRLLAKRNKQLGSQRTAAACRLHALLVELVPGGIPQEITPNRAARLLESIVPTDPVEATRHTLALEHLEDLRRLDTQLRALHRRMADARRSVGNNRDRAVRVRARRRGDRGRLHPRRRPIRQPRSFRRLQRHRSHRGRHPVAGPCTDCHAAATASSTMRSTSPRSPRSGTSTHPAARTTNAS